jgi:hypothetical protein
LQPFASHQRSPPSTKTFFKVGFLGAFFFNFFFNVSHVFSRV